MNVTKAKNAAVLPIQKSLSTLLDDYLYFLDVRRGLAPTTINAYAADLVEFIAYVGNRARFPKITTNLIDAFLVDHARSSGCKAARTSRLLAAIRSYCRHVAGLLSCEDPARNLESPRKPEPLPRHLTESESKRLLIASTSPDAARNPTRNTALVHIALYCGLRVGEIARLTLDRISADFGTLTVVGKGRKERRVPVPGDARQKLRTWCKQLPRSAQHVFCCTDGSALTIRRIQRLIKAIAQHCGLEDVVSPHVLRHTYASLIYANGADLVEIRDLLGHRSINTTQIYTHTSTRRTREAASHITCLDTYQAERNRS